MTESEANGGPKRIYLRIVGKNRDIVKGTLETDAGRSYLVKKVFVEKLLAGEIDNAYLTEVPNSKEFTDKWKSSGAS